MDTIVHLAWAVIALCYLPMYGNIHHPQSVCHHTLKQRELVPRQEHQVCLYLKNKTKQIKNIVTFGSKTHSNWFEQMLLAYYDCSLISIWHREEKYNFHSRPIAGACVVWVTQKNRKSMSISPTCWFTSASIQNRCKHWMKIHENGLTIRRHECLVIISREIIPRETEQTMKWWSYL